MFLDIEKYVLVGVEVSNETKSFNSLSSYNILPVPAYKGGYLIISYLLSVNT